MTDDTFDEMNARLAQRREVARARLQGSMEEPDQSQPAALPQVPAALPEGPQSASPVIDPALLDMVDARIAMRRQQPEAAPSVQQEALDAADGVVREDALGERIEGTEDHWTRQGIPGFINSVGAGAVDAVFQTKDFFTGEPAEEDKSWFRRAHEATSRRTAWSTA